MMSRRIKRTLLALGVLLVLSVVGAAVFLSTLDPNAYKDQLIQLASERYQRNLRIDGDIRLRYFPRLSLFMDGATVSDDRAPDATAAVKGLSLSLAFWPLLARQVKIDRVAADDLLVSNWGVRKLHLTGVSAKVAQDDGHLDISEIQAMLYSGKLTGEVQWGLAPDRDKSLHVRAAMQSIAVQPLLTDLNDYRDLSGNGDFTADLQSSGSDAQTLAQHLNGTLRLSMRDGVLHGVNVAQTLRDLEALVSGKSGDTSDPNKQTDFSALESDINIENGIGAVTRLEAAAPPLRIHQGSPASIDFFRRTLDFVALISVVDAAKVQGGKSLAALDGMTIPLQISGPFSEPSYKLRWNDLVGELLKRRLNKVFKF